MISTETKNPTGSVSPASISQIRNILSGFLQQCNILYPHDITLDITYRDACYADAIRRGFDMKLLRKALDVGIAIGDTAYRHIENFSTRVFIAVWTALLTYLDDYYKTCSDGIDDFLERFMRQEPQRYPVLDHIATMAHEIPHHWGTVTANLIATSEMDYITSTIIDSSIEEMKIQTSMAPGFPQFTRRMTGISRAYCMMVFPRDSDIKTWIQVAPDLMHYIDHVNDLLSFFKEELDGETLNFISMSACAKGITKIEALQRLADETAQCYDRASQLLKSNPEEWEAFRAFCVGYVGFHALSTRYKLEQLQLELPHYLNQTPDQNGAFWRSCESTRVSVIYRSIGTMFSSLLS